MEIELREGIKIVLTDEKAREIVAQTLGLEITKTKETIEKVVISEPAKKRVFRGRTKPNKEKVLGFLRKNKRITSKELGDLIQQCGGSYKIMRELEEERTVTKQMIKGVSVWTYNGEPEDFQILNDEMVEKIVAMKPINSDSKTCVECGQKFYRRNQNNYIWNVKKFCSSKCQMNHCKKIHQQRAKKQVIVEQPENKSPRVRKQKHILTEAQILEAVKNLDVKGIRSDIKGVCRELKYYSTNKGRVSTHLWNLEHKGLITSKGGKKRYKEYTASKAQRLAKKLGITTTTEIISKEPTKTVAKGWVSETLSNDNAYYLIESTIYGRKIDYKDSNIVGVCKNEREWETFGRNVLTHQTDILTEYNVKGKFKWDAKEQTLTFKQTK